MTANLWHSHSLEKFTCVACLPSLLWQSRIATATTRTRKMNSLMLSDVASLSTSVVFLALVGVVVLLSVRACCEVLQVNLTRLVVRLLDGSIVDVHYLSGAGHRSIQDHRLSTPTL